MELRDIVILVTCLLGFSILITVLNRLFKKKSQPIVIPQSARQQEASEKILLPDPIYLPKISTASDKKLEPGSDMVNKYYVDTQIKGDIPGKDDYVKPLGQCPFSKPMSTDLSLGNIPMCMAQRTENMYLRE